MRLLPILLLCVACEDPRPRQDGDPDGALEAGVGQAEAGAGDAAPDAGPDPDFERPPRDAAARDVEEEDAFSPADARWPDARLLDARPPDADELEDAAEDALDDARADRPGDAAPGDADGFADAADATLDQGLPDGPLPDPDAGPPRSFVLGHAEAADGRLEVEISVGAQVFGVQGDFRIGPLPAGRATLSFTAPGHERITVGVDLPAEGEVELAEAIFLYRGQRLTRAIPRRSFFRFDDAWLFWEIEDTLVATPTAPTDLQVLVDADYEVFIGYVPGQEAIAVRKRTQPGIAGDLHLVPLDGQPPFRLFVEAQPYLLWIGERALAMVRTREALSHLEGVAPGGDPVAVGAQVPWLFLRALSEGRVGWAEARDELGESFDLFVGSSDGLQREQISPVDAPAIDAYLGSSPGRRGLVWFDPASALWRWEAEEGPRRIAEQVSTSPTPRFLGDGRVLFWRAGEAGTQDLFVTDGEVEVELVRGARASTFRLVGAGYYVTRPERGLWYGALAGGGAEVIEGLQIEFVTAAGGAIALAEGAAWRHRPGEAAEALGPADLAQLRSGPRGATAWRAETAQLWFLPAWGEAAPAGVVAAEVQPAFRVAEAGGGALYLRDEGGHLRAVMPPGGTEPIPRSQTSIHPIDADRLLSRDDEQGLWQVDPQTGEAFGWARQTTSVLISGRRGFVAYTCDRGLYLVPLE